MKKLISLTCVVFLIYVFSIMALAAPDIVSETAVVIDADTAQVLYDKGAYEKMYPASTTKIMTGLLAVEKGNLDDVCTVSETALDYKPKSASNIALSAGEQISLRRLMYGLAIESANDAANVIAEHIAGSQAEFARLMTQRAKQLGANDTNFINANGLHHDSHYTTAYDLALIARECIKHDDFNTIFSTEKYVVPPTNRQVQRTFNSANWFINGADSYDGIIMSKIGWTDEALHTMVTACKKGDKTLICVVMKSHSKQNKWDDTERLFDWADKTFNKVEFSSEYITLSLPETMDIAGNKNLYVKREDVSCPPVSVMLTANDSRDSVNILRDAPELSDDMQTASFKITLKTGDTALCQLTASAPVHEHTVATQRAVARVNVVSDVVMAVIFGALTFTAVMICDILINKRL